MPLQETNARMKDKKKSKIAVLGEPGAVGAAGVAGVNSPAGQAPSARGVRVAVVVSTYHGEITGALETGARAAFAAAGGAAGDFLAFPAPGAFELPLLAAACAKRADVSAVVAIGCVVQGETRHDRYICDAVTAQLARLAVDTGKPMGYALLTVNNLKQARARAGGSVGNKGQETMDAVLLTLATARDIAGVRE